MSETVKQDILSFMADLNLKIGDIFPLPAFNAQRARRYTPPQQDAIGPALEALVDDGLFEKNNRGYALTGAGFNHIYPVSDSEAIAAVKADILNFLAEIKARPGHALPERPYFHQRVLKYNPKQQQAVDNALKDLVTEGVLEQRNGGFFVTELGYKRIYE